MVTVTEISDKWVLIIDDMEGMRAQMRMSLSSSGFAKLHVVSNIKEALARLAENHYDIILCDYSLGDSTNGQQFLEYLRTNDLIPRSTIFVMATAEQAYGTVVSVSECAPDDYLLKPFTAAELNVRLQKMMNKQKYFAAINQASDKKNWARVIAECDKLLPEKDKYFFDLCKIKASALIHNNQAQQAVDIYREVLAIRPIGWAKLGLARSLAMLGNKAEAEKLAREIVADTPQFMAAYDFLSKLVADSGDQEAALGILQKARDIAPGTMSRLRELTTLAVNTGQPELAEKVMRETLQVHKYSPVRQAGDYAILSKALTVQGKTKDALAVVTDGKKSFSDKSSNVILDVSESLVHRADGNDELASAALDKALAAGDLGNLPADAVMEMANACFALGKEEEATKLLRHTVQNSNEDAAIKDKVHAALVAAGKDASEASALIDDCENEMILLNNDGVRKAQEGHLNEAIELLCEAANRLPNNLQIVGNAALVIALDLVRNGKNAEKLNKCLSYRESLVKKVSDHPKIEQIDKMLKQLTA